MQLKNDYKKIVEMILKNSIKFGVFMYFSAVTIHNLPLPFHLKAVMICVLFAFIFGLKAKPYFIITLIVSIIALVTTDLNLDTISLTFYLVISGFVFLEIRKVLKSFALRLIGIWAKFSKKENIDQQVENIKKAIIEP